MRDGFFGRRRRQAPVFEPWMSSVTAGRWRLTIGPAGEYLRGVPRQAAFFFASKFASLL